MSTVSVREPFEFSAERVWKIVRQFDIPHRANGIVESCEVVMVDGVEERTIRVYGTETRQRLESRDDDKREMVVRTLETALPLEDARSVVTVHEHGPDACEIVWESSFEPQGDEAHITPLVRDFLLASVARVKEILED